MYELLKTSPRSKARLGRLTTARGVIDTPVFMPVGTQASVKALDLRELKEIGTEILLGNTYHLFLRPGMDIIRKAGGLHRFMNWDKPILTDSGGFQVYSLAKIRKVRDDGVEFRSHLSGEMLFLGPRESMAIQRELGSDIAMLFDECPPHGASDSDLQAAVKRTLDWAAICAEQPRAEGQLYFGIVQGANAPELRKRCAEELVAMDFDGYAIGGVSVGEPEPEMMHAVETHRATPAGRQGPLRDGAGYPGAVDRACCTRRGHVRLCAADPCCSERYRLHLARCDQPPSQSPKGGIQPDRGGLRMFRLQAPHTCLPASPAQGR